MCSCHRARCSPATETVRGVDLSLWSWRRCTSLPWLQPTFPAWPSFPLTALLTAADILLASTRFCDPFPRYHSIARPRHPVRLQRHHKFENAFRGFSALVAHGKGKPTRWQQRLLNILPLRTPSPRDKSPFPTPLTTDGAPSSLRSSHPSSLALLPSTSNTIATRSPSTPPA